MNAYQQLYSNVGGCDLSHMFNKKARQECERLFLEGKDKESQADLMLAEAALAQSQKPPAKELSGLAITGIIVGSLIGIAIMVVIIKKTKAARG
jgi:hypothetical protein